MAIELKIPEPFLQRDYEKFNLQLQKLSSKDEEPIAKYRGDMVRAAAICGWLGEGVTPKDIGDFEAKEVYRVATEITQLFLDLVEVPKN
ncbi:MAG: hypothetical protein GWN76_24410 [candidate division Zixibacteria bacterium]|nr:hypothetical protein [candidate division Zixibacteria bacterium]NIS48980.1 hypothetical protein [candidate division Zixibacteria bacterium]NIU17063.1 hypothetical protein [candidate division Zixibacteria bacterium]NIW97064.1 hypothetical protein [Phycisphaerae bacterium]